MIKIAVKNAPSQTFSIVLEGVVVSMRIVYNSRGDFYTLSLETDDFAINGIKIVSGVPLLKGFNKLKGDIVAVNSANYTDDATKDTWNTAVELFYLTEDEAKQIK